VHREDQMRHPNFQVSEIAGLPQARYIPGIDDIENLRTLGVKFLTASMASLPLVASSAYVPVGARPGQKPANAFAPQFHDHN